MVDFRGPVPYEHPHRKPVPPHPSVNHSDLQPLTKIVSDDSPSSQLQQRQANSVPYSAFPPRQASRQPPPTSAVTQQQQQQQQPSQYPAPLSRRTPSQSTTSTTYTGFTPSRTPSNVSSHISRTSSTRSGASVSPGSYVALMRKQKATVWCDRSQHQDPRIIAQQKAAKSRATREINTSLLSVEGRTSTSGSMGSTSLGVRSKIRHHGLPKASGYSANLVGGGVPMRLSANEVGDEGTYNRDVEGQIRHERTGSRGSAGSQNRFLNVGYPPQSTSRRFSSGSPAHSAGRGSPGAENIPEMSEIETPVPGDFQQQQSGNVGDYLSVGGPNAPPGSARTSGGGISSGSSSERESSFGKVGRLEAPPSSTAGTVEGSGGKSSDELRRRGSVDERANTMGYMGGGTRLFVANPDLSD